MFAPCAALAALLFSLDAAIGLPRSKPITTPNLQTGGMYQYLQCNAFSRNSTRSIFYVESQHHSHQTKKKLRSISLNWKALFINGDVTTEPREFDGIKRLNQIALDSGNDVQVDFGGTGAVDGKTITDAGDIIDMFNGLQNKSLGVPEFFITNRVVGSLFDQVLVTAAANNVLATKWSYKVIEVAQGLFAKPLRVRVGMWEDIPVFFIDEDAARQKIIDFNETKGISDITTSVYGVMTGEDFVMGLQKRAQGPIIRQKDSNIGILTKIDWPSAVTYHHPLSVIRATGLLTP